VAMQARIDAVIDRAISTNKIVGAVVLVARDGDEAYARAAGFADREAAIAIRENAIFRFASVTKPLVAATALAMIEQGLLSLDDDVARYLPYFTPKTPDGARPAIAIRRLLSHTSGLGYDYSAIRPSPPAAGDRLRLRTEFFARRQAAAVVCARRTMAIFDRNRRAGRGDRQDRRRNARERVKRYVTDRSG